MSKHDESFARFLADVVPVHHDPRPPVVPEEDPDFSPDGRRPRASVRPKKRARVPVDSEDELVQELIMEATCFEQAKAVGQAKTPEKARAVGQAKTPEKARAVGQAKTPEKARAVGQAKTPEKAKAVEQAKTPEKEKVDKKLRTYLLSDEFRQAIHHADRRIAKSGGRVEPGERFHGEVGMHVWGDSDFPGVELERRHLIFLCNSGPQKYRKFKDFVLPDGQIDETNLKVWTSEFVIHIFLVPTSATKFSGMQDHKTISMPIAARIKFSMVLMKRMVRLWMVFFSIFGINLDYDMAAFYDYQETLCDHIEKKTELFQLIPFVLKHMAVWGYPSMAMNVVNTLETLRVSDMLPKSVTKGMLNEWTFAIEALTAVQFHPSYH